MALLLKKANPKVDFITDIFGDPYGTRTRECMRERHMC